MMSFILRRKSRSVLFQGTGLFKCEDYLGDSPLHCFSPVAPWYSQPAKMVILSWNAIHIFKYVQAEQWNCNERVKYLVINQFNKLWAILIKSKSSNVLSLNHFSACHAVDSCSVHNKINLRSSKRLFACCSLDTSFLLNQQRQSVLSRLFSPYVNRKSPIDFVDIMKSWLSDFITDVIGWSGKNTNLVWQPIKTNNNFITIMHLLWGKNHHMRGQVSFPCGQQKGIKSPFHILHTGNRYMSNVVTWLQVSDELGP